MMSLFPNAPPSLGGETGESLLSGLESFLNDREMDDQNATFLGDTSSFETTPQPEAPDMFTYGESQRSTTPSIASSASTSKSSVTMASAPTIAPAPILSGGAPQGDENVLFAPPNEANQPFVNVFMVIDPKSMTCMVPKQVLSYKNADNVISTCTIGPKIVSAPPSMMGNMEGIKSLQESAATPPPTTSFVELKNQANRLMSTPPPDAVSVSSSASSSSEEEETPAPVAMPAPPAPTTTTSSNNNNSEPLPPLRALSAYNFFFRDERERVLSGVEPDWSEEKKLKLLHEHWYQDRNKKRRHRKTHGKIDFTTLSKLISTRWKELPEPRKDFYRQVAARDFARFKKESKPVELSVPPQPLPPGAFSTHAAVVG